MITVLQHQGRPTYPFTAGTIPPQVVGISWRTQFEDPLFPRTVQPFLQPDRAAFKVYPEVVPVGPAGIPFAFPLSEPRFDNQFQTRQQQSSLQTLTDPAIFSPPILAASLPWLYQFDQPRQIKTPVGWHQTELRLFTSTIASISGVAWNRVWEPPFFPRGTKVTQHKTEARSPDKITTAAISGIGWQVPFDQPKQVSAAALPLFYAWKITPETPPLTWYISFPSNRQSRLPVERQEGTDEWLPLIPSTTPVTIKGISWLFPFDQPKQVKVDIYRQQAEMKGVLISSTLPRPAYLVGRRLPLLTPPVGNFLANLWKGQTDGC